MTIKIGNWKRNEKGRKEMSEEWNARVGSGERR
jgi:hypothetical protein